MNTSHNKANEAFKITGDWKEQSKQLNPNHAVEIF